MYALYVLAIAVALGMDAMSVSMAVGVRWGGARQKFRVAWHMGLFQFAMPILGWIAGRELAALLHGVGTYLAAGLLLVVGAKMLIEALRSDPGSVAEHLAEWKGFHRRRADPTRGLSLVMLSAATSIDALVVGVSLGLRGSGIWVVSVVIGVVAAVMALIGVEVGRRAGAKFGKGAEIAGAVVLILLGVLFLLV